MEDDIDALHDVVHQRAVADIAFDDGDGAPAGGRRDVLAPTAREIVEDDDFRHVLENQPVDDMRTDETRAAGDERTCVAKI